MQHLKRITLTFQITLSLTMFISIVIVMLFIAQSSQKRLTTSIKAQHSYSLNSIHGYLEHYDEEHKKFASTFFEQINILSLLKDSEEKESDKTFLPLVKKYQERDKSLVNINIIFQDNKNIIANTDLLSQAFQTKKIQIGFEFNGSTYRYKLFFPLFHDKTFIGISEFVYDVKHIIDELHRHYGLDLAFIYKKEKLAHYVVSYATQEIFYDITPQLSLYKKRFSNMTLKEKHYSVYKYKLPDNSKNAKIISFYDTTLLLEKRENVLYKLLLILFLVTVVLITFINITVKYFIRIIYEKESESLEKGEELYFKARHNDLSTLPNINIFNEDVHKYKEYSLLLLNIDNLSLLNTSYGTQNVNEIIKEVAKHIKTNLTYNASLYHINVAEFIIVLNEALDKESESLALQIKSYFAQMSIEVEDTITHVNFSIGIAKHDSTNNNILNTFSQANIALVEAKARGKGLILHYQDSMNNVQSYTKLAKNIATLQHYLEEDKLMPYYQAIVDTNTQEVLKYEALARIHDEKGNILSPFHFMQAAEVSGLQCAITRQMIQKSFQKFTSTSIQFSINITKLDFLENYLISFLDIKRKKHNIEPKNVTLEILEDIVIENNSDIVTQINHLASLGYVIAIDDFGVESSNMSKLAKLNTDFVKIDGSFIKDIHTNKTHQHIVESIVHVAHSLHIKTIAEYVHSKEVYAIMKEIGIDYCQGYYFSEPSLEIKDSKD